MGFWNKTVKKVSPEETKTEKPTDSTPPETKNDKPKDTTTELKNEQKERKTDGNVPSKQSTKSLAIKDGDSSSSGSVGSAGSRGPSDTKRRKFNKKKGSGKAVKTCTNLWRRFSCLFLSPVFLRHRNKIYIIFEVFVPPLIAFAIIAAFTAGISWKKATYERSSSDKSTQPKFPEFTLDKAMDFFRNKYLDDTGMALIIFTPVTNLTQEIMSHVLELLRIQDKNKLDITGEVGTGAVGVETPLELLEKALLHRNEKIKHLSPVGIAFEYDENKLDPDTQMPRVMTYSIRMFDESISYTNENFPYVKPDRSINSKTAYVESGFIGLQYAIEFSYFRNLLNKQSRNTKQKSLGAQVLEMESQILSSVEETPTLKMRMFYYPNFYDQTIRYLIAFTVCCCLVVAYLFTSYFIVRQIVQENISGIKDLLRMHGMPVYLHWIILFFHALFFRAITSALMTWIFYTDFGHDPILKISSPTLIFIMLWGHLLHLTFFNFFLATLIHSVNLVGLYSTLIGLLSFIIPVTFNRFKLIGTVSNIFLVACFPNWALYNLFYSIIDFECDDKGVTWSNFYLLDHVTGDGEGEVLMSISSALILMSGSSLLYFLLAIYRDLTSQVKLFPPSFHWWDLWGRSKQKLINRSHHKELVKDIKEGRGQDFEKPVVYEEVDPEKKCHVRIRHLCKRYGKHKLALDTVNLNILHEEITVILGHGGCGKSTLISILAGMVCPTTGYATIKDYDVSFDTNKARKFTGLCTQKLIYFNLLTVKQHVFLCYRLRGYDKDECNRHSSTLLTRLRLWNVRGFYPGALTSDELRRLGIAMAMADAPKVLLLDEPTGGMDSFGRREIWSILKSLKQHHTIILTSNYMDEAEYLADRIALLAHGRLVCFGSVDYLRKQYDTGYFLKVEPYPNITKLDSNLVYNLVKSKLGKKVREKKNKSTKDVDNVIIELPQENLPNLPELCDSLDRQQQKLGFKKYSIRQVCLSDIFIKICEATVAEQESPDLYVRRDSIGEIRTTLGSEIPAFPEAGVVKSKPKVRNQMTALFHKRWIYMRTKNDFFVWEYLIPLCLIFLVMWEAKTFITPPQNSPIRVLNFEPFDKDMEVLYKISADNFAINFTADIIRILGPLGKALPKSSAMSITLMEILKTMDTHKGLGYIKEQHMTALEMRKSQSGKDNSFEMVGHFASGALHSSPIILNTMINVLISAITGNDSEPFSLVAKNHPFPVKTDSNYISGCGLVCNIFAVLLSFAYGFISATTVSFPMRERRNGMKHLQLMTGVHPAIYWASDYVCDAITMLIMTALIGVIFAFDPIGTFRNFEVIMVLMIFTGLYFAWSGLAFSYFVSSLIPLRFTGFNFMILLHVFLGLLTFIWLELAFGFSSSPAIVFMRNILMIFPGFAITCSIHDWFEAIAGNCICDAVSPQVKEMCDKNGKVHTRHTTHPGHFSSEKTLYSFIMKHDNGFGRCCERICKPTNECFKETPLLHLDRESFEHPHLILDIVWLILSGLFYWILLIIAEKRIFARLAQHVISKFLEAKVRKQTCAYHSPKDIKHEGLVVKSIINEESFPGDVAMVVQNLTKSYTATMVINNFTLEVKKGQCVGILGAGGSGKSALMKMMSGSMLPTKGMCYIGNSSLSKHRKQYLSSIGYCPQENTLFDNFTGVQMLELMGRLRGIPGQLLSSHVAKWLMVMGLGDAGKDRCKTYGPGMQRRLVCAMALIGNCPVILLDEATTGVDPMARERFWAVIEHLKGTGQTIIFTTFHTEECLNLATKLVIIAEGNVQCLGNPEDLTNRYARGFCITFRLRHDVLTPVDIVSATMGRVVEFKKAVEGTFLHCDVIDEQDNLLLYFLRDTSLTWGDVYRRVADLFEQFKIIIDSYDVTQATIEDLFILLTNKHKEMDRARRSEPGNEFDVSKEEAELKALEKAAQALHMRI